MPNDPQLDALKVPPHSIEAEQSVLGGLLLDNGAIDRVADIISESDFYNDAHRLIYQHINLLGSHGKPADAITLAESLGSVQKLEYVGGLPYVGALAQNVPSAANIRTYAQIVRERSVLRRLAAVGTEITDSAFTPMGRTAGQLLDEAEAKVFDIAEQGSRGQTGFQEIRPLLTKVVERIEELYNRDNPSDVTGIATGYNDLDSKTSGFQPGDLVIVAGRPSMGKTALVLNICENVALNVGLPVAVFSMEMGATQLAMRMIGSVGKLDQHKIRTGRLHNDDWERLSSALGRLNDAPIHIDETPALNALELRARARRLHRTCGGLGLIVVDYLQLMQAVTQGENRATEISEVSRSLKALAKELQVPVVACSQLNRGLEQRPNKRPIMSDLRECVTGDTLVITTNGARTPIRELVGTTPEVWSIDGAQKIVAARADFVWFKGVKPIFRVTLASGRSIRATAQHRLLAAGGWQRVLDLEVGSRIALARHIPAPQVAAEWPEHELVLLGHLVGDGSYLKHQPLRYTTASEENSAAVKSAAEVLGSVVTRYVGRENWHQLLISGNGNRWHPAGVGKWLKDLGIYGQRSHEKQLPRQVFELGQASVATLLRHLWATDGCIFLRKQKSVGAPRVYFSTCSEHLAHDVAALLLKIGIVARIRKTIQKSYRPLYSVDVNGSIDQLRFLDVVGAFGPRVGPALALRVHLESIVANTNVDTLPNEVFDHVRTARTLRGVSQRKMAALRGTAYGGSSHFAFAPSRATLTSYAELLDDPELRRWAHSDLYWDRVVEIRADGEEEVFDLTVPGPSSWLADGIVSHNSGAIEQDADLILFIYRDEVYNADSTDKGTAEIIIAKQRNGPIGMVRLTFLGEYTRFENFAQSY
jgi:replicative DNA helicase